MRADRLISVLMLLQRRGQITAAEVAVELEVSTRTARRDLEALAMSGVPLYSQPGRGGGWRLVGGARTDLTGLSSDEARALFLALGHQSGDNPVLDAALRKLVVAVPEVFREDAVAASTAIKVDPSGWGNIGGPQQRPAHLDTLSDAVIAGCQAKIRYATPGNRAADRIVHPLGMVTKRGVWYLIANTDKGMRTFRLSRVEAAEPLDAPVDRPADFDLDATWEAIVTTVEAKRTGRTVRAYVDPASIGPVRYVFANRCEILSTLDDGRIEMLLGENSPQSFAHQVAGFGNQIELVDPPDDVVQALRAIATQLADTWL